MEEEDTEGIPDHLDLLEQLKKLCDHDYNQDFTVFLAKIANNSLLI